MSFLGSRDKRAIGFTSFFDLLESPNTLLFSTLLFFTLLCGLLAVETPVLLSFSS
jgi:hypothetical protein